MELEADVAADPTAEISESLMDEDWETVVKSHGGQLLTLTGEIKGIKRLINDLTCEKGEISSHISDLAKQVTRMENKKGWESDLKNLKGELLKKVSDVENRNEIINNELSELNKRCGENHADVTKRLRVTADVLTAKFERGQVELTDKFERGQVELTDKFERGQVELTEKLTEKFEIGQSQLTEFLTEFIDKNEEKNGFIMDSLKQINASFSPRSKFNEPMKPQVDKPEPRMVDNSDCCAKSNLENPSPHGLPAPSGIAHESESTPLHTNLGLHFEPHCERDAVIRGPVGFGTPGINSTFSNVMLPPSHYLFNGKTDWDEFMSYFMGRAEMEGWDNRMRGWQLKLHMIDDARKVLNELPTEDHGDFKKVVDHFSRRYVGTNMKATYLCKSFGRKQNKGESVRDFAWNLRSCVQKAFKEMDKNGIDIIVRQLFVKGLRSSSMAKSIMFQKFESFDDMVNLAALHEEYDGTYEKASPPCIPVMPVFNSKETPLSNSDFEDENRFGDQRMEYIISEFGKVRQSLDSLTNSLSSLSIREKSTPRSEVKCYRCGQMGHLKRNCRTRYCIKCKQMGHSIQFCNVGPPAFDLDSQKANARSNGEFGEQRQSSAIDQEN